MTKFCPKCGRSTPEDFCIVHGDVEQTGSPKALKLRNIYLSYLTEKRAEKMPKQRGKGWHKEPVRHQQASLLGYMRKGHYQATTLERKPATIQHPAKTSESAPRKKPTFTVLADRMTKTERTLTPKFIRGKYTEQERVGFQPTPKEPPRQHMRIIGRHRWVDGATITESISADDKVRRYTATIRGFQNWLIYEGSDWNTQDIIVKVKEIRDRIDKGDDTVFTKKEEKKPIERPRFALTEEIKEKRKGVEAARDRQKIIDKKLYDSKPAQARAYNAGLADAEAGRPSEANLYTFQKDYRRGYKKGSEKPQPIPREEMEALLKESHRITEALEQRAREKTEHERQRDFLTLTLDVIKGFEREYGTATKPQILAGMTAQGYTERETEKGIEKLKLDGHIFEPKYDVYKST